MCSLSKAGAAVTQTHTHTYTHEHKIRHKHTHGLSIFLIPCHKLLCMYMYNYACKNEAEEPKWLGLNWTNYLPHVQTCLDMHPFIQCLSWKIKWLLSKVTFLPVTGQWVCTGTLTETNQYQSNFVVVTLKCSAWAKENSWHYRKDYNVNNYYQKWSVTLELECVDRIPHTSSTNDFYLQFIRHITRFTVTWLGFC